MSRNQSLTIIVSCLSLLTNVLFDYIFIPKFGLSGSAIATSSSIIVANVIAYAFLLRETGINTLSFKINA